MIVAGLIYKIYRVILYLSSNTSRAWFAKQQLNFLLTLLQWIVILYIDDNPIGIVYAQWSRCARMANLISISFFLAQENPRHLINDLRKVSKPPPPSTEGMFGCPMKRGSYRESSLMTRTYVQYPWKHLDQFGSIHNRTICWRWVAHSFYFL
jgi:hypothetical protein